MTTNLRRSIASLLIVSITGLGVPLPAQAGMVSTESSVAADRDRIATLLDRSDMRAQLEARGVSSFDAKARVAALTDEEVAQLAGQIDTLPAGAADPITAVAGGLMVVAYIAILVVAALVTAVVKGIQGSNKKTTTDEFHTGSGQEAEVKH